MFHGVSHSARHKYVTQGWGIHRKRNGDMKCEFKILCVIPNLTYEHKEDSSFIFVEDDSLGDTEIESGVKNKTEKGELGRSEERAPIGEPRA